MFFGAPGTNLYTNEGLGKISHRINQGQNPHHLGNARAKIESSPYPKKNSGIINGARLLRNGQDKPVG